MSIIEQVIEQLRSMPQHLQQRVLEYTHTLVSSQVQGVPGQYLLRFAGAIPPDELNWLKAA